MSAPPSTLGSYPVERELGRGGMGVVYLARDPRLNRPVAIKVLPDGLARDADHLARFEREATLLAALNHPNIAGIYGLEAGAGGERLLVLEYVAGETLANRIARGPLPIDEALGIAGQIAAALAAAHDAGIIHRDLKPANVKVRDDGTVKVLDFGLAKAFTPGSKDPGLHPSDSPTNIPTMTSPALTGIGVILGTAAYMSPEQARGRAVDRRADIWSLGAVLFEMLTGQRPFGGETVTDVLASVVTREPDWHRLPAATPAAVTRLLRRCLVKDPKRRLRDAADLRVEIEDALAAPVESPADIGKDARGSRRRSLWAAMAALALLVIVGTAAYLTGRSSAGTTDQAFRMLSLTAPGFNAPVAISPNGEWLAAMSKGQLYIRRLDEPTWHEVPNVSGIQAGAGSVFWSPDSLQVGFATDTAIKRVDLVGSRPTTICEHCVSQDGLRGSSWSRDDVILIGGTGTGEKGGLQAIAVADGRITRVTSLDASRGENSHRFPAFLPDGQRYLFAVRRSNGEHEIRLGSLESTVPPKTVVSGFSQVRYAAGHILFVRNAALFAQRFDVATEAVLGDPVKLFDRISHSATIGSARFSVADDGTLVAASAPDAVGFKWFDRHGTAVAQLTDVTSSANARVSVDGRRVVISLLDPEKASADVYVIDVETRTRTRLTSNPNWEEAGVWSPSGRQVAYRANNDRPGVYAQDANGGNERLLLEQSPPPYPLDWSPDGKYVIASSWVPDTVSDLVLISTSGPTHVEPWLATNASEDNARFSPNGQFVAYTSTESGSGQIHVRSFANPAITRRVTTSGGACPVWSSSGRELFYMDLDQWITAVSITTGATIEIGPPQKLFRIAQRDFADSAFDVDKQGRFLIYDIVNSHVTPTLTLLEVLLNWSSVSGKR